MCAWCATSLRMEALAVNEGPQVARNVGLAHVRCNVDAINEV